MPPEKTKAVTQPATPEIQPALARTHLDPRWPEILASIVLGITLTSVGAVCRGKYIGWDQRSYHYYSVYAWLNHRVTYHIEPGQEQSWLNPLILLPHYLAINYTPPAVAGAIFGAFGGINLILVYLLARCVVSTERLAPAVIVGLLSAAVGASDPKFLEELGGSNSDVAVSIPVLAGLLAICWSHRRAASARTRDLGYGLSGLLFGMAVGLKMTSAVFAVGLTLTLVALWFRLHVGVRRFAYYAAGDVLGYLLTAGYWNWFLWREYRNPIFPFYNSIFRSPWAIPENFEDLRFQPRSMAGWISYPFQWFTGLHPTTSEATFRDGRFALLMVLLAVTALGLFAKLVFMHRKGTVSTVPKRHSRTAASAAEGRGASGAKARTLPVPSGTTEVVPFRTPGRLVESEHFWLLLIFSGISYVVWITTFAVQRYFLPIGLLIGLLLFLMLDRLFARLSVKIAAFALLAVFSIAWTKTYPWQHVPYGKDWFGVRLSPAVSAPNTLFIMLGGKPIMLGEPMGYVVPYLPKSARVIYLSANMPLEPWTRLGQQASHIIATHDGPIRTLAVSPLQGRDYFQLKRFGLILDPAGCETFRSEVDQFTSCPMQREADLTGISQAVPYRDK